MTSVARLRQVMQSTVEEYRPRQIGDGLEQRRAVGTVGIRCAENSAWDEHFARSIIALSPVYWWPQPDRQ